MKLIMSMFFIGVFGVSSIGIAQEPVVEVTERSVLPIHLKAAREFTLYADTSKKTVYKLEEEPVFVWSNPRRSGGQAGHIFLWKEGTQPRAPRAVCTVFSFGAKGVATDRRIVFEWHTLSESTLLPERAEIDSAWKPMSGVEFLSIPKATAPSDIAAVQKREMKAAAAKFDIHSIDQQNQRWQLRVLSAPLYNYQTQNGQAALIGWVGDAGNDPELMMLLEIRGSKGAKAWHYCPVRMTDHQLFVELDGDRVWQSVRSDTDTIFNDSDHRYFRFVDRIVQMTAEDLKDAKTKPPKN